MIVFQYTKTDGAEYISHLDLLRQIDRTLRRAEITVKKSEAVNRHPRIYLSAPLGVGLKSLAEYGTVDTDYDGDFVAAFNAKAPLGVRCVRAVTVSENPNVANTIVACTYQIRGLAPFPVAEVLAKPELILTDKRGRTKDVRQSILSLEAENGVLTATLATGASTLRPDVLAEYLVSVYGGRVGEIVKTRSLFAENAIQF